MCFWQAFRPGSFVRILLVTTAVTALTSGCAGVAERLSITPLGADQASNESDDRISQEPTITHASRVDWGPFSDLSRLELAFQGIDPGDLVYVNGPYELVYWDEQRVELVGEAFPQLEPAHLTLLQRGPELWAHLRVESAEYLTRVE